MPDSNWLTATDPGANTSVRTSFPTPSVSPFGRQSFRAYVRKTTGAGSPALNLSLYENGSLIRKIIDALPITSLTGQLVEAVWDADEIATANGSLVEALLEGIATDGATPSLFGQGAGAVSSTSTLTLAYPASIVEGDVLIMQIGLLDNDGDVTVTAPSSPWQTKHAAEGLHSTYDARQAIFWRYVPAGGLSGSIDVTVATPDSSDRVAGRIYAFRGCHPTDPFEGGEMQSNTASQTSMVMPAVTTTGANRLCVAFLTNGVNNAVGDASGESGGNWAEAVAEYTVSAGAAGTLQLQTAQMAAAGTITGGSVAITSSGWVTRGFALKPPKNTVEFGALKWWSGETVVSANQYDETGKLVTIASTIVKTEQVDYKQTGKLVTIVAPISKTEQVDYKQTGKLITVVTPITETDIYTIGGIEYDETGLLVTVQAAVIEAEQVDFKDTGKYIGIIAISTGADRADYIENPSLGVLGSIYEADQADYKEPLAFIVTDEITETDVYTVGGVNYDETGLAVLISSQTTETDTLKGIEGHILLVVSQVAAVDEAAFAEPLAVTVEAVTLAVDRADFGEARAIAINSSVASSEVMHRTEPLALTITAALAETDQREHNETSRLVSIVSVPAALSVAHFASQGLSFTIGSTFSAADRADFEEARAISALAVLSEEDRADYTQAEAFTITAVITEADFLQTPGHYDETSRRVTISSFTEIVTAMQAHEYKALVVGSDIKSYDALNMPETRNLVISSSLASVDNQHMAETCLLSLLTTTTGAARADYNEVRLLSILAEILLEENMPSHYNETLREVLITALTESDAVLHAQESLEFAVDALLDEFDSLGWLEARGITISSDVKETDRAAYDETGKLIDIISEVFWIKYNAYQERGLEILLRAIIKGRSFDDLYKPPFSYLLSTRVTESVLERVVTESAMEIYSTRSEISDVRTKAETKDVRTWDT